MPIQHQLHQFYQWTLIVTVYPIYPPHLKSRWQGKEISVVRGGGDNTPHFVKPIMYYSSHLVTKMYMAGAPYPRSLISRALSSNVNIQYPFIEWNISHYRVEVVTLTLDQLPKSTVVHKRLKCAAGDIQSLTWRCRYAVIYVGCAGWLLCRSQKFKCSSKFYLHIFKGCRLFCRNGRFP